MNTTKGDTTQGMKTLLETINESIAKGFIENFKITASGLSSWKAVQPMHHERSLFQISSGLKDTPILMITVFFI